MMQARHYMVSAVRADTRCVYGHTSADIQLSVTITVESGPRVKLTMWSVPPGAAASLTLIT